LKTTGKKTKIKKISQRVSTGNWFMKKVFFILTLLVFITFSAFLVTSTEEEKDSKNISLFSSVFKLLKSDFVDTLDSDILIRRAIDGMVKSVDPHTVFFDEKETQERVKVWQGIVYSGIGARVTSRDSAIVITYPIEGFGAQQNDLRAGDTYIEIDSIPIKGKTMDSVIAMLRGAPETAVNVTVERPYVGIIRKKITRKQIVNQSIPFYTMLDTISGTGYIQVQQFLAGSDNQFIKAVKELKKNPGLGSIILDLRDNIGGLVEEAVNCVNVFIPKNTVVIHLHGKSTDYNNVTHNEPIDTLMPLVILTNSNTISAGEIFTGAMQDLDRAVIIGQKTFGKGFVQGTRFPGYGTNLYVTAARYYTPSGRCIQKRDYSKRYIDGKERIFPDTLKKMFYTHNGRKVYDIGGIEPDIKTEPQQTENPVINALDNAYLIFDYATYFRNTKVIKVPADKLVITDIGFNDFLRFVEKKQYSFTIAEEQKLKEFEALMKKDNTTDLFNKKYQSLYQQVVKQKREILIQNREPIKRALQKEIVTRYYYNTGMLQNSLTSDQEILKAKEILASPKTYNEILNRK
jgi:carboxyl-terminal processing protease